VDAQQLNIEVLGRSLTRQTWGICSKIADVDSFLAEDPAAARPLREVHPEVCFWALSGGTPMRHKKSTVAGRRERLDVLVRHEPSATALLRRALSETRRQDVQADDVLDALVALLTAESPDTCLKSLAEEPYRDQRALVMEMLYVALANGSNLAVHRTGARVAHPGR
jgi:predicted RNase H-like nuclease